MANYTVSEVASKIDHAVLKPDRLRRTCGRMRKCVRSRVWQHVCAALRCEARGRAAEGLPVMVSCVLSFPHGADTTSVKVCQAQQAIADGVQEIDMVMNIGQFLSGNFDCVREDIQAVVEVAHANGVKVKVIQESCLLSLEQVARACELSRDAGADFVKTSTGFNGSGASPEIVEVMVRTVGDTLQVKPSGGIKDWETAVAYLEMGADRLGIGSTLAVLHGGQAEGAY